MKFFIASPWRNKDAVRSLTGDLMRRGHIAYSFINNGANLATGTSVAVEVEQFGNQIADWGDNRNSRGPSAAIADSDFGGPYRIGLFACDNIRCKRYGPTFLRSYCISILNRLLFVIACTRRSPAWRCRPQ